MLIKSVPHDQKVMFQKSDQFEAPRKEEAEDDPWGLLQPGIITLPGSSSSNELTKTPIAGRGFIEVPLDVTRSDGSKSVDKQYYCISMFHQLHCLVRPISSFRTLQLTLSRQVSKPPSSPHQTTNMNSFIWTIASTTSDKL